MKFGYFNTGRGYTPEGQRVYYMATESEEHEDYLGMIHTVHFYDATRMIVGIVAVRHLDEEDIMEQYDKNNYEPICLSSDAIMKIKHHFAISERPRNFALTPLERKMMDAIIDAEPTLTITAAFEAMDHFLAKYNSDELHVLRCRASDEPAFFMVWTPETKSFGYPDEEQ